MTHTDYRPEEIDQVMQAAAASLMPYRKRTAGQRAFFLEVIANEIEALGDALILKASEETNLPAGRLLGERGRTVMQLSMFAAMLREGSWAGLTIETAQPDRKPVPKQDIRKMSIPLGPVVVFGASNFPFAYSTAGGDTASALAAGCPVVVKAHPAHAGTSEMVAGAIRKAIKTANMPANVFQHVFGAGAEVGKALVQHSATAAVGFTGSLAGGKALYDYAHERRIPIPVFSEMGSVNPVIFLPDTLKNNAASLAKLYAGSITTGMGQFCTKPGLLIALDTDSLSVFSNHLSDAVRQVEPAKMLHTGIQKAYHTKLKAALDQSGVETVVRVEAISSDEGGSPVIATVTGEDFLKNPLLHEEVFGPYSLLIKCRDKSTMKQVWQAVAGQLTTSIMGTDKDFADHRDLLDVAESIAGRIVFNSVPTGVEVCSAMVHGGPFPATTDSRFTAVGADAVKRWVRPVCYQNCPEALLPLELKNSNPSGAWRKVNNEWTREPL